MQDTTRKTIASNVAKRRLQKGWSRKELATRAGVSYGTVYNIESTDTGISLTSLAKIGKVLNRAVEDLTAPTDAAMPVPAPLTAAAASDIAAVMTEVRALRRLVEDLTARLGVTP